ncbi:9670_t:CDS:2 [Acaulospora morrowiae]|uniref:9670_t:CDS:1 n=1 Tax=Acaulospora morrowiae TaxID=94023 RepID=A0A9N8ZVC5_9GLOM|nr:9670_t:CDS:2 [Acaulospora morrowiae]
MPDTEAKTKFETRRQSVKEGGRLEQHLNDAGEKFIGTVKHGIDTVLHPSSRSKKGAINNHTSNIIRELSETEQVQYNTIPSLYNYTEENINYFELKGALIGCYAF